MTTVSAGSAASETLIARSTVTITTDANEAARLIVTRSGAIVASTSATHEQTFGPFLAGDIVTIQSLRGAVDYTINGLASVSNDLSSSQVSAGAVGVAGVTASGTLVNGFGTDRYKAVGREVAGALVCDWGAAGALSTTGSTGTGFAFALDTAEVLNGKSTVKCTFQSDATAQTFIGTWTPTNPIRLRDVQVIHVPIKYTSSNSAGGVGNPFQVWIGTSSGKSIRLQLSWANGTGNPGLGRAGEWATYSFQRGATAITGSGTIADLDTASETITTIKIVQATTGATANTNPVWVGEIRADAKRTPGRVTIVMDGEYSSQYDIMRPLLNTAGIKASMAIINSDIGGSGRLTATQLDTMYADGHEMIHHTYDGTKTNGYVNSTDWATSLLIAEDIRAQWAYFTTRGWTRGIGFGVWGFAYSFESGQTQARQNLVRDALRAGGMVAMRKSAPYNENAKHLIPISRMPVDPMILSGGIQITNTDTAAGVQAVIDAAEATGQWAIITVHRAVADGVTPSSLEMTATNMATWINYLKTRIDAGGVVAAPFGETYQTVFGDKYTA